MQRFFHQENYKFVLKFASSSPALKLQKRNEVSVSKSKVVNERLLQQNFPLLRMALKIFFSIYYLFMKGKRSLFLHTTIITTEKMVKKDEQFCESHLANIVITTWKIVVGFLLFFCKIKNSCRSHVGFGKCLKKKISILPQHVPFFIATL